MRPDPEAGRREPGFRVGIGEYSDRVQGEKREADGSRGMKGIEGPRDP